MTEWASFMSGTESSAGGIRAEHLQAGRDINIAINSSAAIRAAMRAVSREEPLSDTERAAAVPGFLRTLGEREVPLEHLPAKLTRDRRAPSRPPEAAGGALR